LKLTFLEKTGLGTLQTWSPIIAAIIIFLYFRLTAFVAKSFRAASPYITIDPGMVRQSLQWLQGVQATNGSFPEVGKVHHQDMQGGAASGLALTAYTLITFLQDKVSAIGCA
jgi:hypothetical protein